MYRQHVLIQLYSLRLGRLVSPSLFRPRYFQKARYVIIRVSLYGYEQRSDRRTHDDAADELSENHDAHKLPGGYGKQPTRV